MATEATARALSRSIVRNRFEQFASLYDPDNEPTETESTPRRNPQLRHDHNGHATSLPLLMGDKAYRSYRLTRLEKNPHCTFCGREVDTKTASLDHCTPESRSGKNWPANLVLACCDCNTEKSDRTLPEWSADILAEIDRLQQIADRLDGLIGDGGDCFVASLRKQQEAPRPAPDRPTNEDGSWAPHNFDHGKRTYWLIDAVTRQPIIRHLGITQAMHVLQSIGSEGLILTMLTPLYHALLGPDRPSIRNAITQPEAEPSPVEPQRDSSEA
jgi:5-methylcytosine-specific restriction endonuclease McrA